MEGMLLNGTLLFNIGIDLFSAMVALIICMSYHRFFSDTCENQLMRRLEVSLILLLITDIGTWVFDGKPGESIHLLLYGLSLFYYIMLTVAVGTWTEYAHVRIYGRNLSKNLNKYFLKLPFIVFLAFLFTTPWTGWCFTIDSANVYHRGTFALLYYGIIMGYLVSTTVLAWLRYQKEKQIDRREELLTISFFAVPVIIGGSLQTFLYGLSLEWPCAVISSLLIAFNKCRQSISRDSLTGLNNRRNLDRYLNTYPEIAPIAIIMVDINLFKEINDKFGHGAGDTALAAAAEVLRTACDKTMAFLARYGGDEFVIVLPINQKKQVEALVTEIKGNFVRLNRAKTLPHPISASIGYAVSPVADQNAIAESLKKADDAMYLDKAVFYEQNGPKSKGGAQ